MADVVQNPHEFISYQFPSVSFDDVEAAVTVAGKNDVTTYEFANVAISVVEGLEKIQTVHLGSHVLRFTQNRVAEKSLFRELNIWGD